MLRFGSTDDDFTAQRRVRSGVDRTVRWRLWMLLIALGLVIATMRQLNRPSTAVRLGQVFGAQDSEQQLDAEEPTVVSIDETVRREPGVAAPLPSDGDREDASDPLARVQDNTYFRPAEQEAWFELLGRLQSIDSQELLTQSQGELTYAQLLEQPDVYRGHVVTIAGLLRQESVEPAPANELGIQHYHRLVIQPHGGGHWPFVVYALELPAELPRGDDLNTSVTVHGYFFKNWSYAWQDGLGIAPVVLARTVDWQPAPPRTPPPSFSKKRLSIALSIACVFAVAVVWLALHNTRRPRSYHPTIAFPADEEAEAHE